MTPEQKKALYKQLSQPFPEEAIERTDGLQTGKGYSTTGIKAQFIINRLNETLGNWPRVKITPMFGRWGYFVGPRLFAFFAGWGSTALPGPRGLGFLTVYIIAPALGAILGAQLYDVVLRPSLPERN